MKKLSALLLLVCLPAMSQPAGVAGTKLSLRQENRVSGKTLEPWLSGRVTIVNQTGAALKDVKTVAHVATPEGRFLLDMLGEDISSLPAKGSKEIGFYARFPDRIYKLNVSFDVSWKGGKTTLPAQLIEAGY